MTQLIKGDIWLTGHSDKIDIKTKNKRFQISDAKAVTALNKVFPDMNKMILSRRDIANLEHDQINLFMNKFLSAKGTDSPMQPADYEYINMLEQASDHENALEAIHKADGTSDLIVVLPIQNVPYIFIGTKQSIISFILSKDLQIRSGNIQLINFMNLKNSIHYCLLGHIDQSKLHVFTVNDDDSDRFTPINIVDDLVSVDEIENQHELLHFKENKFLHEPIKELKNFIKQTPYLFGDFGYGDLKQVPFNIAQFTYIKEHKEVSHLYSDTHPLHALFHVFKEGMSKMLSEAEPDDDHCHWICCSSTEELYRKGVIPLIFHYYRNHFPAQIEIVHSKLNEQELDSEILNMILNVHKDHAAAQDDVQIVLEHLQGTNFYCIQIAVNGYVLLTDYDVNINRLLNNGIQQFYAKHIQNKMSLKEDNQRFNLKQGAILKNTVDEFIVPDHSEDVGTETENFLSTNNITIHLSPWKYNHYLEKANLNCLKIKLGSFQNANREAGGE